MDNHDNRIPVGLTADEYIFIRDQSAEEGLTQSALIRRLINEYRRQVALSRLSVNERYETSLNSASNQHQSVDDMARFFAFAAAAYQKMGKL